MNKNSFTGGDQNQTSGVGTSSGSSGTTGSSAAGSSGGVGYESKMDYGKSDNKKSRGNKRSSDRADLGEQGEEQMSLDRVKDITKNLGDQLETQMRERPYVVLGAVAGVGFVAGSLLGSRLGQIAIAIAGGYVVRNLVNQAIGGGGVQKFVKEGIDKISGSERHAG